MYLLAKNRGIVSKLLYLIKDTNPQTNIQSSFPPTHSVFENRVFIFSEKSS